MKVNPLIPIGAKIKVDKSKIKTILPNKLLDDLPKLINGKILDYKMTDGMGIGYVIITDDNLKIWIFSTELNNQTRSEYNMEGTNEQNNQKNNFHLLGVNNVAYDLNGNRTIKAIINPINLIKWLVFTLKDIF